MDEPQEKVRRFIADTTARLSAFRVTLGAIIFSLSDAQKATALEALRALYDGELNALRALGAALGDEEQICASLDAELGFFQPLLRARQMPRSPQ